MVRQLRQERALRIYLAALDVVFTLAMIHQGGWLLLTVPVFAYFTWINGRQAHRCHRCLRSPFLFLLALEHEFGGDR